MDKNKSHYIVVQTSEANYEEFSREIDALENAKSFCENDQEEFTVYKAVYGVTLPKTTPTVIKLK